jgi:hypothetical protein
VWTALVVVSVSNPERRRRRFRNCAEKGFGRSRIMERERRRSERDDCRHSVFRVDGVEKPRIDGAVVGLASIRASFR